jgi:enoyl-CoA hydratase/carnithine racemase
MEYAGDGIEARVDAGVGRLLLNRPKALNAMDGPMFAAIDTVLAAWRDDPSVRAVTIRGAGRGFCAGGDIKYTSTTARAGGHPAIDALYRTEYRVDGTIHRFAKPLAALVHGVCMGGGMGLAMHAPLRIVADDAVLAMPETEIGFFPDCGVSWLYVRLPGALGTYLALTGTRLNAADALALGLASHVVRADALDAAAAAVTLPPVERDIALAALAPELAPSALPARRALIDAAFGAPSARAIVAALERDRSAWAVETLATLRRMSPTSVCVAFALLQRERALSLEDALALEYEIARRNAFAPEFHEGVRAVVIDKDRNPTWSPPRIEDVDPEDIERYLDEVTSQQIPL